MVDTPRKVGIVDQLTYDTMEYASNRCFPFRLSAAFVHLVAFLRIFVPRYEGSTARRAASTSQSQHPGRWKSGSVGENERTGAGDGVGGRADNSRFDGQRVPRPSFRH